MFCCFKKDGQVYHLHSEVQVRAVFGGMFSEPTRWDGIITSEKGGFRKWADLPGAVLGEIEADAIATSHGDCGTWAKLPLGLCLAAVVLEPQTADSGAVYRPVKIYTRPAPELKSYLKSDRYPLIGRLQDNLVFKRAPKDFILTGEELKG